MPIRVSYLLSAIHSPHAGTEGHLLRLIRSLDRSAFSPELILMQRTDWASNFHDPRVPTTILDFQSFRRPRDWTVVSKLAKHFRQQQTDVVEMHSTDAQFVGGVAAKLSRVPVAISCRRNLGYQYGRREKMLQRVANRFATSFLANADVVADKMSRLEGIPRHRFDVIHNGIDLAGFDDAAQQTDPQVAAFQQITAHQPVISIAANLRPVKNLSLFLRAAKLVATEIPNVRFAIMGHGEMEAGLRQQAQELEITDRVLWLGSVPTVAPYLVRSDVACLTSTSEGFSNSIIEYMAARLPVVVTNVGGAAEAVAEGDTGYVVPSDDEEVFADRLRHLLRMDPDRRQAMGRRGRQRVEDQFSMAAQLQAYRELYHAELDRLRPQSPGENSQEPESARIQAP